MSSTSRNCNKYNFPSELLAYLHLRNEAYTVQFIMDEILRKSTANDIAKTYYKVPKELAIIMMKRNNVYGDIVFKKKQIKTYIEQLKIICNNDYISVTDILSSREVKQIVVVI